MKKLFIILTLMSCSSTYDDLKTKNVMVIRKLPSTRCIYKKNVIFNQVAGTYEQGINSLKKQVYNFGGNTLLVKRHSNKDDERRIVGAAYKCP